jgi:hypothetical protein
MDYRSNWGHSRVSGDGSTVSTLFTVKLIVPQGKHGFVVTDMRANNLFNTGISRVRNVLLTLNRLSAIACLWNMSLLRAERGTHTGGRICMSKIIMPSLDLPLIATDSMPEIHSGRHFVAIVTLDRLLAYPSWPFLSVCLRCLLLGLDDMVLLLSYKCGLTALGAGEQPRSS